jgi:hypothetical protein
METIQGHAAWNKGKLVGQKPPLKPKDIWAIRIYLQNAHAVRDLAMFNLAIDSKLRGCDLVSLRVRDVPLGNRILPGSYQAGKHCPVSRNRGGRRVGNLRANRNLRAPDGGRADHSVWPLSGIMSSERSRPGAVVARCSS